MARANAAYYATHDPFTDFTTAPELTQVFGEILGAWAKIVWQMMGAPDDIQLAEAGPGRGLMMADILRSFGPAEVYFIEASPKLRTEQQKNVPNAHFIRSVNHLTPKNFILFANEFLDALSVRQFIRRNSGWMERYVDDGQYCEVETDVELPEAPVGTVREQLSSGGPAFIKQIAERGGVGLIIDYGYINDAPGETVQAIQNGKFVDPLANPGEADISAHVNFKFVADIAQAAGADVQGPVKQNAFLTALGLHQRTDFLARKHPEMAEKLRLAAQRLTAPEAMGSLFKVLAITPPGFPTLPGFET